MLASEQRHDGYAHVERFERAVHSAIRQRIEREQILVELKRNHQRMTDTARALGLERSHLYKKCQALGIDLRAMREGSATPQTGDSLENASRPR